MPIYEYQCENCDHCFEKLVFASDDELPTCPECTGKKVKKLVSCSSFIGSSGLGSCTGATGGFS